MLKKFMIMSLLIMAVFPSPGAYCQSDTNGEQSSVISGKVVKADPEGGYVQIKTSKGKMTFGITSQSELYMFAHHMSIIEISKGDPVTIQYITRSNKNIVIKMIDKKINKQ